MGDLDKGNPYGNAFPPVKQTEEKDPEQTQETTQGNNQESNQEPNQEITQDTIQDNNLDTNEESNDYLAALLEKKPKVVKRNFEVYAHINKRLEKAANKYRYGFLKKFINAAIEKELDWLDEQEGKMRKPKTKNPDQR